MTYNNLQNLFYVSHVHLKKDEKAATHFCQDCDEPEPMCHTCATEHLKQRSGRGHCLNDNIKAMPGYQNITFKVSQR